MEKSFIWMFKNNIFIFIIDYSVNMNMKNKIYENDGLVHNGCNSGMRKR